MLASLFARLPILGALALMVAASASAQVRPEPGLAFSQEFGPGWLSHLVPHPDGGFVVAGRIFAPGDGLEGVNGQHPVVMRLGPDGAVRWEQAFVNRSQGEPHAVEIVPGAGIRVTGFAGPYVEKPPYRRLDWIAEIDDAGRVTRDESLDLTRPKHEGRFIPVTSSTFAFYGSTNLETGEPGVDIFATDARGSRLWRARMPDVAGDCEGAAIAEPDGRLAAVVGTWSASLSPEGARFRRFDASGRMSHDRRLGAFTDACPLAIARVPGRGFIVTGVRSQATGPNGWVALLDGDGSLVWERLFGPTGQGVAAGYQGAPAPDGSVVVAGCIDAAAAEGVVLRYSRTGDLTGERRFASESGINPVAVQVAADGSVALAGVLGRRCGYISGNTAGGTAWVAGLTPEGLTAPAR